MILTNNHRRIPALLNLIAVSGLNFFNFAQPHCARLAVATVLTAAAGSAVAVQFRESRGPRRD